MNLLLISPESTQSEQLKKMISSKFRKSIHVHHAVDIESMMEMINDYSPIMAIIFDVMNKNFNVLNILNILKEQIGLKPTLFLGNLNVLKNLIPQEFYIAHELNEFLISPLDHKEVNFKLQKIIEWYKKSNFESSFIENADDDFISMKIRFFYVLDQFDYDLYIKIAEGKFQKILSAHSMLNQSFLLNYSRKGLKEFHIKKNDHLNYLVTEGNRCLEALEVSSKKKQTSHQLLIKSIHISQYYLQSVGITELVQQLLEEVADNIYNTFTRIKSLKSFLEKYPFDLDSVASKSLLTSYLSGMLAEELKFTSLMAQKRLYIASIIIDYKGQEDFLYKINHLYDPRFQFVTEEIKEKFAQHPVENALLASELPGYPDLDFLIINHHEYPNREGFPRKPGHANLNLSNAILNISQYIAAEIVDKKPDKKDWNRIFQQLENYFQIGSFKEVLNCLTKILNRENLN